MTPKFDNYVNSLGEGVMRKGTTLGGALAGAALGGAIGTLAGGGLGAGAGAVKAGKDIVKAKGLGNVAAVGTAIPKTALAGLGGAGVGGAVGAVGGGLAGGYATRKAQDVVFGKEKKKKIEEVAPAIAVAGAQAARMAATTAAKYGGKAIKGLKAVAGKPVSASGKALGGAAKASATKKARIAAAKGAGSAAVGGLATHGAMDLAKGDKKEDDK